MLRNLSSSLLPIFFKKISHQRFLLIFQSKPISTSPVPSHQHVAQLIVDQKSANQALQTFRWASKLHDFTHDRTTYRALIHKLCSFRRFDTVKELLDEMPSSIGSRPDEDIFVTVVRGFGRAKMIREAIKVLELLPKFETTPTLKLYNSILDVLVKFDIDIAREFYRKKMIENGVHGDHYTYGILMKGLSLTNRIGDAFKLLQIMKTKGIKPNTVIYNTLLHSLCKNGKVGRARSLMNEMSAPNDATFNILISAYCGEENLVQALVMLEKCFNNGFVPDIITVTKVVEFLCNVGRAMDAIEVFERVESKGGKIDVLAYNTLIKGFCRAGKVKIGQSFLKEMERKGCLPTVGTYNTLIAGFCKSGMLDSALDLFNEMKLVGITWNFATFDFLIRGLCSRGRIKDGFKILELMEETKEGSGGCISPYNSIIYGLYKEERLDEALEFLHKMRKLFPKVVNTSLKILGFCNEGILEDAKRVYQSMIEEVDFVPNVVVYVNLILGFCSKGDVKGAIEVMGDMVCQGWIPIASTINVVIVGLCEQGRVERAVKLAEDIGVRGCLADSGSYNPMIEAFCRKGEVDKGLMLLLDMVGKELVPDYCCWNVLVHCLNPETKWGSFSY